MAFLDNDEDSHDDDDLDMSSRDDEEEQPTHAPTYEGEDTHPTTHRELQGWLAYPIAAEVFAVVAVGAFLPVILEQLARENGTFFGDRGRPCVDHSGGGGGTAIDKEKVGKGGDEGQCMIHYLGKEMSTSSFAMYTFSAAVLMQAIVLICASSFADYGTLSSFLPPSPSHSALLVHAVKQGPYRKKMLITTSYTGALASCLFIFITPSVYYLAPILVILGVTSLGCSFVLLNAFLPLLVARHPDNNDNSVGKSRVANSAAADVELENLHPSSTTPAQQRTEKDKLTRSLSRSAQISSKGVGYGYISAVFVQILGILIIYLFSKTEISKSSPSLSIRIILVLVGMWWAIFSIPTLLWLRPRPGPPLPTQASGPGGGGRGKLRTLLFYTMFSLRSFYKTVKKAVKLRQTLYFLLSWFLLSDAVATISGTAVLFARTELHMGTIPIALLSITSIGSGVIGAFVWPRIQRRFGLQPKTVLLCCVAGLEIIPLYGLLGYIPVFKHWGFIGLQKSWEIYPVAVVHGIVMGGISSYARSVYAPLIPEGSEAAFFALFAVTDKGSSAFGPALVGWIVDKAGTIRPAFIFLAVVVVAPAPLLWRLDMERGREDARAMAEREGDNVARGMYERVRVE
ncbi:MFS transporter family [Pyrenophora seminiperda CCB06]|uniref:Autophagy-related protein n=1 Tax=Pyrenophora seminiperda CCB06 TaxID=1302712 RepID=A0A3M7M7Q0_9PLEO|nr:MFS transporter family [Pyrenophora seminiperda CCB06]